MRKMRARGFSSGVSSTRLVPSHTGCEHLQVMSRAVTRAAERRFFIASAMVIAALCFAGFARSYYLRAWLGKRALAPILQLHGLIMTAWIVLFTVQIVFIAKHRIQLHRKLGVLGALLAALVV